MVASLIRRAPLAARSVLGVALLLVGTEQAAYQDLGSLLVGQPGVADRARTFLLTSPFSSLRTATFSLPNPMGAAIPRLPLPDHFQVLNASLQRAGRSHATEIDGPSGRGPEIVRAGKTDRLIPTPKAIVRTMEPRRFMPAAPETDASADFPIDTELSVIDVEPFPESPDFAGTIARDINPVPPSGALVRLSQFFFGIDANELPPLAFEHVLPSPVERLRLASLSDGPVDGTTSVARKGVVTGDEATPKTPAERLGLAGLKRTKAEKCLADAVYFESRGEPERGQVAVAQVVINRVFSGYYPEDVCETVYQNAHRYLACQFTFACEGKKLIVDDQTAWTRAKRIAREMLDGKLWLNEVGKATHYHANWVRPGWVREMRTIQRIGVHTFYRPRKWDETEG